MKNRDWLSRSTFPRKVSKTSKKMTDDAFAHLVTNYFSAIRYHLIETLQLTFLVIIETLSIVGYQIKSNFGLNNLKKSQMSFMKSQISKN